jgi:hypothetical protein
VELPFGKLVLVLVNLVDLWLLDLVMKVVVVDLLHQDIILVILDLVLLMLDRVVVVVVDILMVMVEVVLVNLVDLEELLLFRV